MPSTKTGIEWCTAVWNPMTGCTQISAGCDHCYALAVANTKTRQHYLAQAPVRNSAANRANPFAPRFWEDRLIQPLRWRKPQRIFVNSMSDVYHASFSFDMIARVFDVMNRADRHQFLLLTKRPERALRYADRLAWTPNIWIGTSVEDMRVAHRAELLRQLTQAAVRFVSAEPLLGPLDALDLQGIDWVIGGGESGRGHRPCDPEWVRGLRDSCVAGKVAFFFKQWGGHTPKAGGRVLDGRTWDQYPRALVA